MGCMRGIEVFERQPGADVEWRLVYVRNKHVGFGGISHRKRKTSPWSGRIEGALVVPGTEETEQIRCEWAQEKAVHFVQRPNQRSLHFSQYFPAHKSTKIGINEDSAGLGAGR